MDTLRLLKEEIITQKVSHLKVEKITEMLNVEQRMIETQEEIIEIIKILNLERKRDNLKDFYK